MWTDIQAPRSPLDARGIGITGVAAAIANAVFNATGKRICDLPITLDKLRQARLDQGPTKPVTGAFQQNNRRAFRARPGRTQ
jgi:hypothetical protein